MDRNTINRTYSTIPTAFASRASAENRFYLNVPFSEKDEAKILGARWDPIRKQWYFTNVTKWELFAKWLPDGPVAQNNTPTLSDLSDEQRHVIDVAKKGKNILVDACIGSGKTTTIQVLCDEMKEKNILYLTYNRLLKEDARQKIHAANVMVTNYHGFAFKILKDLGHNVSPYDAVDRYNITRPEIPSFDLLVLDEYQDIDEAIAKMLLHIKGVNKGIQIIAVGDMEQKIYDHTTLSIKDFINNLLGKHEDLNFSNCYRLSKDHAARLGRLWNKNINGVNDKCKIETMYQSDVVKFLSTQKTSDILCLGQRGDGLMTRTLNALEKKYPEKFNKNNVYASIRDEERSAPYNPGSAIFTTFDGSKGMERKICVVFDFTEEYWEARVTKPGAKYEIIRNLFLVAASRGKERIIFVIEDSNSKKASTPLSDKTISTVVEQEYHRIKPFNASDMYDFNYEEHIKECLKYIQKTPVRQRDRSIIEVESMDGNIDLSPCIGIYTEASYFKGYDIDTQINLTKATDSSDRTLKLDETASLERKILALVAYETKQKRYEWQVKPPFLTDEQKERIYDRLYGKLREDDEVQTECDSIFYGKDGKKFQIKGICDVIRGKHVYELKFTTALSDQHFLQTAYYICALNMEYGYLWNIKTNEFYKVSVPDKDAFLKATVKSITKGNVKLKKGSFVFAN